VFNQLRASGNCSKFKELQTLKWCRYWRCGVNRNPTVFLLTLQSCKEITDDGLYYLGKALKALPYLKRVRLYFYWYILFKCQILNLLWKLWKVNTFRSPKRYQKSQRPSFLGEPSRYFWSVTHSFEIYRSINRFTDTTIPRLKAFKKLQALNFHLPA